MESYEVGQPLIPSFAFVPSSLMDTGWGELMNFVVDSIPRAWEFTSLKVEFMVGVNMIRQKVSVQGCALESQDNPSASWWALHTFVNSIDAKNSFNLMCLLLGVVNVVSLVSFKAKTWGILLSFLGSFSSYAVRSWEYFPSKL